MLSRFATFSFLSNAPPLRQRKFPRKFQRKTPTYSVSDYTIIPLMPHEKQEKRKKNETKLLFGLGRRK